MRVPRSRCSWFAEGLAKQHGAIEAGGGDIDLADGAVEQRGAAQIDAFAVGRGPQVEAAFEVCFPARQDFRSGEIDHVNYQSLSPLREEQPAAFAGARGRRPNPPTRTGLPRVMVFGLSSYTCLRRGHTACRHRAPEPARCCLLPGR